METDKKLSKDAKPGQMTLRGTITKPNIQGVVLDKPNVFMPEVEGPDEEDDGAQQNLSGMKDVTPSD